MTNYEAGTLLVVLLLAYGMLRGNALPLLADYFVAFTLMFAAIACFTWPMVVFR